MVVNELRPHLLNWIQIIVWQIEARLNLWQYVIMY